MNPSQPTPLPESLRQAIKTSMESFLGRAVDNRFFDHVASALATSLAEAEKPVAQCSIEELIAEISRLAQAASAVGNSAIGTRLEWAAKHLRREITEAFATRLTSVSASDKTSRIADAAAECFEIIGDRAWEFESDDKSVERFAAIIERHLPAHPASQVVAGDTTRPKANGMTRPLLRLTNGEDGVWLHVATKKGLNAGFCLGKLDNPKLIVDRAIVAAIEEQNEAASAPVSEKLATPTDKAVRARAAADEWFGSDFLGTEKQREALASIITRICFEEGDRYERLLGLLVEISEETDLRNIRGTIQHALKEFNK